MEDFNGTIPDNATDAMFNITSAPSFAPTSTEDLPCFIAINIPCDSATADGDMSKEALWMILWTVSLIAFVCLPFCISQSRRELCWRRIKERRWISDDREDDWYTAAVRRQQEQRRQHVEEEQRRFRTSRNQEDEIREQYLMQCMENFTMTLSESDIHETEDMYSKAGSIRSLGSRMSFRGSRKMGQKEDEEPSRSGPIPMDMEAQQLEVDQDVKKKRSDSMTDDEEEQAVLALDFDDGHQKVYVPLPGHTAMDTEAMDGAPSVRRMVNSGCAICLCHFEPEEKITWSANPNCSHIFHGDCILHWYLAVGRKSQSRRLRRQPNMTDEEILSTLCDFPTNCPSCRQNFCQDVRKLDASASLSSRTAMESDSDEEAQRDDLDADNVETGLGSSNGSISS